MQIPDMVQYFDIGGRGAALVLLTYLTIQVREIKRQFSARLDRLEALHMQSTPHDKEVTK